MKRFIRFALAAACIVGCVKKEIPAPQYEGNVINFRITAEFPQGSSDSKVALNEDGQLDWTGDETATLIFGKKGTGNRNNPVLASVAPGVFAGSVTLPEGYGLEDLQGIVVPAENGADFRGDHKDGKRIRMYIPEEQTQKQEGVFNPAYCPIYAPLTETDLVPDGDTYTVPSLKLMGAADMVRFNVYGAAGEKVKSVRVSATNRIAATVEINLDETGYGTNGTAIITVTAEDEPVMGAVKEDGARIFCAMSLGGNRRICEVQVVTDKATYTKTVDVTMPAKKAGTYNVNIYPVNLDLQTFMKMDNEVHDYYYRKVLSITKRAGLPSMQVTYTSGDDTMISFVAVNEDFYAQEGRKQENSPLNTMTVYQACSMSKVPLAYVAMKMVEEGRLDLMKPVYRYWADYSDSDDAAATAEKDAANGMLALFADETAKARAKLITAKMILLHTTGLDNGTYSNIRAEDDGDSDTWEWSREPDYTTYLYSGPAIHILDMTLGKILGDELGEEYDDLAEYSVHYIFNKIGIVNANYFWKDDYSRIAAIGHRKSGSWGGVNPTGWKESNAAYSLRTSTEEYTRFLKWINDGADFKDKANYDAMFAKYGVSTDKEGLSWQGLVWRMENNPDIGLMYHHRGNNGNYKGWMCTIPDQDRTLMFMTNGETSYNFYQAMAELFLGAKTTALAGTGSALPPEETDTEGNAGKVIVVEE